MDGHGTRLWSGSEHTEHTSRWIKHLWQLFGKLQHCKYNKVNGLHHYMKCLKCFTTWSPAVQPYFQSLCTQIIHTNQKFCSHTPRQIYLQKWSATKHLSSTTLNRYVGTPVHGRVITVSSFKVIACMQTSHCISFCTTPQFALCRIRACLQTVSTASLG